MLSAYFKKFPYGMGEKQTTVVTIGINALMEFLLLTTTAS
jgi:hypothetical protein